MEDVTVTNWRTRVSTVIAWAKNHPGFMIPAIAYIWGVATPLILRHIF
jgi:hypothetical protein